MEKDKKLFIIDDFVTDEEAKNLIEISRKFPYEPFGNDYGHFAMRALITASDAPFQWLDKRIKKNFLSHTNKKYYFTSYNFDLRHNKNNLQPHHDLAEWNFILYLDGAHQLYNGTGFWTNPLENGNLDLNTYIGFQRKRAIMFTGKDILHGSMQGLGESSNRLTLSIFFFEDKKNDPHYDEKNVKEI